MNEQDRDAGWMRLALSEAAKGLGRTSPNPCVGAVVVKDGRLLAKGWHKKAGTPHAEVHALRAAGEAARGATLYVTLEPCNHSGRTPPCTEAILAAGIRRVVVGMPDPNPHVPGGGCAFLARRGIEVECGLLAEECRALNRPFIKYIRTGLPWLVMKAGVSLDGRIAAQVGRQSWITGEASLRQVHRLRDRVDAILVGSGTVRVDDPSLTTRLPDGRGRDPLRVVLDTRLAMNPAAKMLAQDSTAQTWIFCGPDPDRKRLAALTAAGAVVKPVPLSAGGLLDLPSVLAELGQAQQTSLLVEGGSAVHTAFWRAGLVDAVQLFVAPVFLGEGALPLLGSLAGMPGNPRLLIKEVRRFGEDVLIEGLVVTADDGPQ